MSRITIWAASAAVASWAVGCSGTPNQGRCMHTLTWDGYSGIENPRDARYLFDGQSMGIGKPGFDAALSRIKELPSGSRLLIYPSYLAGTPSGPRRVRPYVEYGGFGRVIRERSLEVWYGEQVHYFGKCKPGVEGHNAQ